MVGGDWALRAAISDWAAASASARQSGVEEEEGVSSSEASEEESESESSEDEGEGEGEEVGEEVAEAAPE